ncbi:MAG: SDR family oxidoreductase [Rhizobiaceae bacterium]
MSSNNFHSSHYLITGGTSGIGYELVRQLHERNAVSVIGRPSSGLDALKQKFPGIRTYAADLADSEDVALAADKIVKRGEAVDVLINNAAVQNTPQFLDDDFCVETIKREIAVNLTAPSVLIYLTLPVLLQSSKATVLNINSGLALAPKTSSAVYCATKGGLNILSQSLSHQFECANIRVMQAFLPLVDTGMTEGRGSGKLSAAEAANQILEGLNGKSLNIDIGKVKLLRLLMRLSPSLAQRIMRRG